MVQIHTSLQWADTRGIERCLRIIGI